MRAACEHYGCGQAGVRRILVDAGPLGTFWAWACQHHADQWQANPARD